LTSRHRHQNATAIQIVKTPVGLISESVRPFVNFKQNRCILDGSGCGGWLRAPSPGILFVAPHPPSPGAVPAPYTPKSPTRHLLMPAEVVLSWTQGLAQPKGPPRGGGRSCATPIPHRSPWATEAPGRSAVSYTVAVKPSCCRGEPVLPLLFRCLGTGISLPLPTGLVPNGRAGNARSGPIRNLSVELVPVIVVPLPSI